MIEPLKMQISTSPNSLMVVPAPKRRAAAASFSLPPNSYRKKDSIELKEEFPASEAVKRGEEEAAKKRLNARGKCVLAAFTNSFRSFQTGLRPLFTSPF